jgi:hypothetical protein
MGAIALLAMLALHPLQFHAQNSGGNPQGQKPPRKTIVIPPVETQGWQKGKTKIVVPPDGAGGNVFPAETALCFIILGCKYPHPQITGVVPFSNFTPGGYIVIFGNHFNPPDGLTPGKLQFRFDQTVHDLVDLQWSDTAVGGRVPNDFNPPGEQTVELWVLRADGLKSDVLMPQPMIAPVYDIQMLLGTDLTDVHCARADDWWCDTTTSVVVTGSTVVADHASTYGHDAGTDSYKMPLKNGWKIYEVQFGTFNLHNGSVQDPSFDPSSNPFEVKVHWDQDGGGIIGGMGAITQYWLKIFIRGPKGLPWK